MDSQIKKGLIDVCILAVLLKEDSYGYQIIRDVSHLVEISESTLYPVLKRLQTNNLVTTYDVAYNGRLRKYYKITDKGKLRLIEVKEELESINHIYNYISLITKNRRI